MAPTPIYVENCRSFKCSNAQHNICTSIRSICIIVLAIGNPVFRCHVLPPRPGDGQQNGTLPWPSLTRGAIQLQSPNVKMIVNMRWWWYWPSFDTTVDFPVCVEDQNFSYSQPMFLYRVVVQPTMEHKNRFDVLGALYLPYSVRWNLFGDTRCPKAIDPFWLCPFVWNFQRPNVPLSTGTNPCRF